MADTIARSSQQGAVKAACSPLDLALSKRQTDAQVFIPRCWQNWNSLYSYNNDAATYEQD
jgi:hypothetical protein